MSWKPFVVGVDASPQAAQAAALACRMASKAGTTCHLVHAARDVWASVQGEEDADELRRVFLERARAHIRAALRDVVAREPMDQLTVQLGRAAIVLKRAAAHFRAELVVVGSKHHSPLGRWLGGSTSLNVARTTEVPLLVVASGPTVIRRVFVAVDGSAASRPTLRAADRYAALFGAELRGLSVLEPLPATPEGKAPDATDYYRMLEEFLKREVWPLIRTPGVERLVRYGRAVETVLREATEWQADLLVVGSHSRGWAERMLSSSVTERLLNHLPTSLLVVPTRALAVAEEDEALEAEVARAFVAIA